ncbi:MAG: efflux RND transporter periplasmic adaptor subunit [Acidobacteriota bacterium]
MRTHILSLAGLALLLAGCARQEVHSAGAAEPGPGGTPVRAAVIAVKAEPFTATIAITGTLISTTRVDVKAQTIGKVERFPKEEGDPVKAGEPVVWIEQDNYRLAVGQAEAAVRVAEAALERARVAESHSEAELERARNLVRSGGITDRDLKAAQLAQQDARAQVALAAAQLAQANAALAVTRKHLQDTVIPAPVSGEIEKKFVNPGAYVEAPTEVFTLVDNSKLELASSVAAAELAPIRAGQRVTFSVNSFPRAIFEARVIEVNPAVDAETRSARVRIRVDNSGGRLKAGMFATGEILTGVEARAIVVPAAAVYRSDGSGRESYVYVVDNGKAVRRAVRIGRERDSRLELLAGLREGDQLIAEQSVELAEGVRVMAR